MRGWKIDSNLATLRRSERTPPGGGGAQPHQPPPPLLTPPRRYVHHHRRCFLPPATAFSPSPAFLSRDPATWPSQDSSIYIEKINIWASSGSFARAVNKPPGCVRVSNSPYSSPPAAVYRYPVLPVPRSSASFSRRQRSTSCCSSSPSFFRPRANACQA